MQKNVLKLLPPELKRKNWNVSIWYACKAIDQNFGYGCWFLDGHVQRRWVMAPTIYIYIYYVYVLPLYTNVAVSLLTDEPSLRVYNIS